MIIRGGKEIVARFHGQRALASTYHGLQLVYRVRSDTAPAVINVERQKGLWTRAENERLGGA